MTISIPAPADRALLLRISKMKLAALAIEESEPYWRKTLEIAADVAGELADEAEWESMAGVDR